MLDIYTLSVYTISIEIRYSSEYQLRMFQFRINWNYIIEAQKMVLGILIRRIDFLTTIIMTFMIVSLYYMTVLVNKIRTKLRERRRNRDDKGNA